MNYKICSDKIYKSHHISLERMESGFSFLQQFTGGSHLTHDQAGVNPQCHLVPTTLTGKAEGGSSPLSYQGQTTTQDTINLNPKGLKIQVTNFFHESGTWESERAKLECFESLWDHLDWYKGHDDEFFNGLTKKYGDNFVEGTKWEVERLG